MEPETADGVDSGCLCVRKWIMNDLHAMPLNDEVAMRPLVGGGGRKWSYLAGVVLLFLLYWWAGMPV